MRSLILHTIDNVSKLQPRISKSDVRATSMKPYWVTVEVHDIGGRQSVTFVLNGHELSHTFLVGSFPTEAQVY